jgi:hypothetical protein
MCRNPAPGLSGSAVLKDKICIDEIATVAVHDPLQNAL